MLNLRLKTPHKLLFINPNTFLSGYLARIHQLKITSSKTGNVDVSPASTELSGLSTIPDPYVNVSALIIPIPPLQNDLLLKWIASHRLSEKRYHSLI
jgi:hypothetical protein